MKYKMTQALVTVMILFVLVGGASAQAPAGLGSEEFGFTQKELVRAIEKVEALIAKCMSEQGFKYVAADYKTVSAGMNADKMLPGIPDSEEKFIEKYGYGISTVYSGQPPQLAKGYSPDRVGLGERNTQIFKNLLPADQVAYNRTLLGQNTGATFAVALELENLSLTGGCTKKAVDQVFQQDKLKGTYRNPLDTLIDKDPRMKSALRKYTEEMRKAGFDYKHPDDVESDIRERLKTITNGGTILVEKMSPQQLVALKELQGYERKIAMENSKLEEEIVAPVEQKIERELFAHEVK